MLEGINGINPPKNIIELPYIIMCMQAVNVDAICAAITAVAVDRCPEMEDLAQAVAHKCGRALLLFSKCHNAYNSSNSFQDSDISSLRK